MWEAKTSNLETAVKRWLKEHDTDFYELRTTHHPTLSKEDRWRKILCKT